MTTPTTVNVRLQLRADTAANWTAANPILLANEVGLETDTKKLKVGDGSTAWASLAYFPSIVSGGTVLGNLEIGSTGTLTFEGSTANDFETTLAVTDPTADRTITLPDQSGTVVVSGNASIVDADIAANAEIAVSKLANGTANQVIVTDGTNVSWSDDLTLAGNLTVNGTTTTINTQDLLVEDKNIILGNVDTPTDVTADGGGITLKGATDKTINWVDATDAWTSSEHIELASGKSYRINGAEVLNATTLGSGVTSSSLTSVGTISAGTWQGTAIDAAYLDSTVVTTGDTGSVTSTMIADGTIVNADVSASAAIAGSKIDPDFGSQTIETTGDLAINTNTLFVDASANAVGIGTGSPEAKLTIQSNNSDVYTTASRGDAWLQVLNLDATSGVYAGIELRARGTGSDGVANILCVDTGSGNGDLTLGTRNAGTYAERMRITSAGNVGIGTTSPAYQLQLATDSAGKPSTNTWTIVSDERIKEEIELADLDLCYEAVKNIPLKRFKWKDEVYTEEQAYDRRKLGWIAQDVEAVFPKAVRQHEFKYNQVFEEVVIPAVPAELDDDGNIITEEQPERIEKGELISEEVIEDCRDLNSDQLYAAMYGAIQKLISKVELLEAEVQALKAA